MLPITPEELSRWRAEVEMGVDFRVKEFGTYGQRHQEPTGAGKNIASFEQGARQEPEGVPVAPLNLLFPIVRTILPTLFYQNPRANAIPDERNEEGAEDAFYVSQLLNRDLRDPDFRLKETGNLTVFDAVVPGAGFVKIGYATKFGQDILPTKKEEKAGALQRLKQQVETIIEAVGLKAPEAKPPEPEQVQPDLTIRSEAGYVRWVSCFNMAIDPRAHDLSDARWMGELLLTTVGEAKRNRNYAEAERKKLVGDPIENTTGIPDAYIEEFQTIEIWEVHYKNPESPTGITTLTFAKSQAMTTALRHEHSVYDLGGWQYEWLVPNKHGHRLWPISSLSVCRPLLDRINSSFAVVLEQLDKFMVKVAVNDRVDAVGQTALQSPVIGAVVKVSGETDVRAAIAVIGMEQVNAEIVTFLNYCVDFIILIVGLTRAQLTGLTTAQTATEAQIGQGGSNLRRSDEANLVGEFLNRVVTKYWRVKAQFQDFTEVSLVQQSGVPNAATGIESVSWYPPIDAARNARLKTMKFQQHIEMGSIQKPNLEIVRAQFEQFARTLMEPIVTQGLALEGKRLSAEAFIREYSKFFAEYGLTRLEKIVVPITDPHLQQQLMNYGMKPTPQNGNGVAMTPNRADLMSAAAGEKGQGAPGA